MIIIVAFIPLVSVVAVPIVVVVVAVVVVVVDAAGVVSSGPRCLLSFHPDPVVAVKAVRARVERTAPGFYP